MVPGSFRIRSFNRLPKTGIPLSFSERTDPKIRIPAEGKGFTMTVAKQPSRKSAKISLKRVFATSGAIVSFMIGAGFSTGQETLQYYTSMGLWGIGGVVVAYLSVFFLYYCFMMTGSRIGVAHSKDVFRYYCGRHLGAFYEILSLVMLFLITTSMVGGAGAIVQQLFGVPEAFARVLICMILAASVIMGVRGIIRVLGPIGPVIIIALFLVAAYSLANASSSPADVAVFLETCDPPVLKISDWWWWAGILYGVSNVYPLASYGSALGKNAASRKEAVLSAALGCVALTATASTVALSQMANIDVVYDQAVPTLALIQAHMPAVVAALFSVVAVLGIYTTICPSMWAFSQAFGEDRSRRYVVATLVSTAAIFAISYLPYEWLINLFYPLSGYAAILMIVCMAVKHIRIAYRRAKGTYIEIKCLDDREDPGLAALVGDGEDR